MLKRYGIYGYEISREICLDGFKLTPFFRNYAEAKEKASDSNNYNLTGFLEIDEAIFPDKKSLIFDVQGVLSFIDQKSVLITHELRANESAGKLSKDYPVNITAFKRNNGAGSLILGDAFSPESRKGFIELSLSKLKQSDASGGVFRGAFFKSIEVFRISESFVDVNYYLLFSALESLSRFYLNDYTTRNCSIPIAKFLSLYGFDINQESRDIYDLEKSVSTYTKLRNALFHNGSYESRIKVNGECATISLFDFYPKLKILIPLVMLKNIGFDDGHVNWNCWLDRMPFK